MISDASCDTEDWSNHALKSHSLNCILKYIKLEKKIFLIEILLHNITGFAVFLDK